MRAVYTIVNKMLKFYLALNDCVNMFELFTQSRTTSVMAGMSEPIEKLLNTQIKTARTAHVRLASFLLGIGKQCRPIRGSKNAESDQDLHCLLAECSIKIE